jgi:hypothetical protein
MSGLLGSRAQGNRTGSPVSDLMHLAEWRIIPVSTTTLVFERGGVLHVPLESHAFRSNSENASFWNLPEFVIYLEVERNHINFRSTCIQIEEIVEVFPICSN